MQLVIRVRGIEGRDENLVKEMENFAVLLDEFRSTLLKKSRQQTKENKVEKEPALPIQQDIVVLSDFMKRSINCTVKVRNINR